MNQKLASVTLERGSTITNVNEFNRCNLILPATNYREWVLKLRVENDEFNFKFVLPEEGARYLTTNEAMNFLSEFLHTKGTFSVDISEFESKTESEPIWKPVTKFKITKNDGDGTSFGVRIVDGLNGYIQLSNIKRSDYLPEGREFILLRQSLPTHLIENNIADNYQLSQNYPNPFNPSTKIHLSLPKTTKVTVEVFNNLGQRVAILLDEIKSAGIHILNFDGSRLASGIYHYRFTTPEFSQTKMMVLAK